MAINRYEKQLSGGHPNSLGNTEAVVADVLKSKAKLNDLLACYKSDDEVVRLRVSSAIKRVCKAKPDWVAEHTDLLLDEISKIDQASTKWTLATVFMLLSSHLENNQRDKAMLIMKHNLMSDDDWIVQNTTIESLAYFAQSDDELMGWLKPQLTRISKSSRHKSVAKRAEKLLAKL